MQIILMEKVPNLGQLGDVVKVREGYARNYLIPQGKAKRATQANLAEFEATRADLERDQGEKLAHAQAQAASQAGDWDAAVTALEQVVALDASYRDAQSRLREARLERERQRQQAAVPTPSRPSSGPLARQAKEPWARLIRVMMPNTRVSPADMRNSITPSWSPFSACSSNSRI